MNIDLSKLKEDRDVVEPFIERLMQRLREKHPHIALEDVSLHIEVSLPAGATRNPFFDVYRLLVEMDKEGVVI